LEEQKHQILKEEVQASFTSIQSALGTAEK
jgi:hypothetical protein